MSLRSQLIIVALLVVSAFIAGSVWNNRGWEKKWAERDAADAESKAASETHEREEEQRRQQAANEEQKRANEELAKVQADADAAQHAADGLQRQLDRARKQLLADSETSKLSAVAAERTTKTQVANVLTELLGEANQMAGEFGKEADERYAAGKACENTYRRVTDGQD